ncbi:MAG TPA: penicillin-binding transpeptidase domain-containing protein [Candidatus Paceibacterota bacterium]|nr:penicillin-binding transpeptidase domain-containing protein [Candidatus Paceibacterota bacterium]
MRRHFARTRTKDIEPDEIFLDSENIPEFDEHQFEGRLEKPIGRGTIMLVAFAFLAIGTIFAWRTGVLQINQGAAYAALSENNRLEHEHVFPERGIIRDRLGTELAWNVPATEAMGFSLRRYISDPGFAHVLGYIRYPARDKKGNFYRTDYEADSGVESAYNDRLKGKTGLRIIETNALGETLSSNVIDPPRSGENLDLSIDARIQAELYRIIHRVAEERDFRGGAGVVMDIETGELLALVSAPEFDPNMMTEAKDTAAIAKVMNDPRTPFLNRVVSGLYTPGSIVKPIYALGALSEGIITPEKQILSTGSIRVPNPYVPGNDSVFTDWRAHGWLDMRTAIAQSSNVYFYEIGGGFQGQRGLGVRNLEKYARMFGFGSSTGIELSGERDGTIPNPTWKEKVFPGDPWRIGDTYFTSIGQYGVQVTPLQAAKEASIIASKGLVPTPRLLRGQATSTIDLEIPDAYFDIIQEGMRKAVTEGTAKALNIPEFRVAAKTGTAELGISKRRVNSWVIGFFPYEKPRYAFAIVMESGIKGNLVGAAYVAKELLQYIAYETPEYVGRTKRPRPEPVPTAPITLPDPQATSTVAAAPQATSTEMQPPTDEQVDETPIAL